MALLVGEELEGKVCLEGVTKHFMFLAEVYVFLLRLVRLLLSTTGSIGCYRTYRTLPLSGAIRRYRALSGAIGHRTTGMLQIASDSDRSLCLSDSIGTLSDALSGHYRGITILYRASHRTIGGPAGLSTSIFHATMHITVGGQPSHEEVCTTVGSKRVSETSCLTSRPLAPIYCDI